eukprot:s529_g30.t2
MQHHCHTRSVQELADAFKKLQDVLQAGKADAAASNSTSSGDASDIADILGGAAGAGAEARPQKDYMKANVFLLLLEHCADWAEGVDMDQELPKLNFHVAGLNGAQTELSLRPKNYIMTATADINVPEMKTLGGLTFQIERKKRGKVCMPAFQPAPFTTKLNGEVWIMGTPLFYEYTAHYDRGSADGKVKPSMAFTHVHEEPCGRCQDNRIVRGGHPALTQTLAEVGAASGLNWIPVERSKWHQVSSRNRERPQRWPQIGQVSESLGLLGCWPAGGSQAGALRWQSLAYGKSLRAHAKRSAWSLALEQLQLLADGSTSPNVVIFNTAISACARGRQWTAACNLLLLISQTQILPDTISFNTCISSCDGIAQWRQSLVLFDGMRLSQMQPDVITYSGVISACAHSSDWLMVLALLQQMGTDTQIPDVIIYGSAIKFAEKAGQWQIAAELLEMMERADVLPNVISCNSAISSCEKAGEWLAALMLLLSLEGRGLQADVISFNGAISACEKVRNWLAALSLLQMTKCWHVVPDVISFSGVISACEKSTAWGQALSLLGGIRSAELLLDVIACSSAVSACEKASRWLAALSLLMSLPKDEVRPNVITWNSVISACEGVGLWEWALHLLETMQGFFLVPDVVTYSSAISSCGKRGAWQTALALLRRLALGTASANAVSLNAAIQACAAAWQWQRSLALLADMGPGSLQADVLSFRAAASWRKWLKVWACECEWHWLPALHVLKKLEGMWRAWPRASRSAQARLGSSSPQALFDRMNQLAEATQRVLYKRQLEAWGLLKPRAEEADWALLLLKAQEQVTGSDLPSLGALLDAAGLDFSLRKGRAERGGSCASAGGGRGKHLSRPWAPMREVELGCLSELPKRNAANTYHKRKAYSIVIKAFAQEGRPSEAAAWLQLLADPDIEAFNTVMHGYARLGQVEEAEAWMSRAIALHLEPSLVETQGSSISLLAPCFVAAAVRNLVSYTTLVETWKATGNTVFACVRCATLKLPIIDSSCLAWTKTRISNAGANAVLCIVPSRGLLRQVRAAWPRSALPQTARSLVSEPMKAHMSTQRYYQQFLEGHAQRCNLDVLNFDEGRPERAGHGSETLPSSQGLIAFAGFSRIKSTRGANTGTSDSPCAKAIDACAKLGYVAEAEKLFQEMQVLHLDPGLESFTGLVRAVSRAGQPAEVAESWLRRAEAALKADVVILNSVIAAWARARASVCPRMFLDIPVNRWCFHMAPSRFFDMRNDVLDGYPFNSSCRRLEMWSDASSGHLLGNRLDGMTSRKLAPTAASFTSALAACGSGAKGQQRRTADEIWRRLLQHPVDLDPRLCAAVERARLPLPCLGRLLEWTCRRLPLGSLVLTMPTPPRDEESLREEVRQEVREPPAGGSSPVMPSRRAVSPRGAAGAGASSEKRFVDYKMEAAPTWDGEQPETKYKEYARNLKLWLIEATERLPGSLIGKRIIDAIPYGSRLAALLAHMSVEEITDATGYERIVATIEEAHDYLKDAKLEQAFDQAIFKGRRRADQSLSGFVATKKAAFGELKRQGLDLLNTSAGSHLLGHLLLRQGNFTEDQKQRIKVLTDGSIDFPKVEKAIRKLFGETVDEPTQRTRSFWQDTNEDGNGYGDEDDDDTRLAFWEEATTYVEETFEDLLEFDEATGETYMIVEDQPPAEIEEMDAIEYLGDYLTWVFFEAKDRFSKGKGKGKGKPSKGKGKGKQSGKDRKMPGTFGVYGAGCGQPGTYLDHRRALQEARTGRGFTNNRHDRADGRHRVSVSDLMSRTRCHQCKQVGHWARNCPHRQGPPKRFATGGGKPPVGSGGPTAAMFFVDPPGAGHQGFYSQIEGGSAVEQYMCESTCLEVNAFALPPVPDSNQRKHHHTDNYLNYSFATTNEEPGRALIDTAAQHGLIGRETLEKMDNHLQQNFGVRVQHTSEDGGTVRGVCGVEEKTPIAYIPVGVAGYCGQLRVQIVPGSVPCLVPAYLLTDLGSVIDMRSMRIYHTHINCMQSMSQKHSGHVEVSLTEFGPQGFRVPLHAMSALMEMTREPHLRVARRLAIRRERMEQRAMLLQQQENFILAKAKAEKREPTRSYLPDDAGDLLRPRAQHIGRSKFLAPVLRSSPTCQHVKVSHGANAQWAWAKCEQCGSVEQIPKLTPDQMQEWNTVMVYQKPGQEDGEATEEGHQGHHISQAGRPGTDTDEVLAASTGETSGPMSVEADGPHYIGTPASSAQPPPSSVVDLEQELFEDTMNLMRCEPPAETRSCTLCPSGDLNLYRLHEPRLLIWVCCHGDPACKYTWQGKIPHEQMSPAFGVKLCLECQQNEVKKVTWKGREAWLCDQCGDRTLASEWWEAYNAMLSQGGYDPRNLAKLRDLEQISDSGWSTLVSLVNAERSYFWKFHGTKVPGTKNAMLKTPLRRRVLLSMDEGQPNVIDINYGSFTEYDLGSHEPVSIYVIQEFEQDFIEELKDLVYDPIEVTMEKSTKRVLLDSLDRICGPAYEEYLTACEDEHRNPEPTVENLRWSLPTPEERDYWIERAQEDDKSRRWRRVGDNLVLCLLPSDFGFMPAVGPGYRHLRWTADLHQGQWWWREQAAQGPPQGIARRPDSGTVVVYSAGLPDPVEDFASHQELTNQEKRAVLRSHVNLGHPSQDEFVRLLKAAGCRADVISYVQREFTCSGCDLEKRPPTRLPASTPRCYDFNVVIGIDVLFVHGLDNRTEHPVLNITCLGTLYSTFGLIDHTRRSAQLTFKAFERMWLRTFGPPEFMILDQGTEFTGAAFQAGLERHCVQPLFIDQDAPFENGVTERRGGLFKNVYYRSRELAQPRDMDEVEALIYEVSWSLQTMCNRSGYSPAQRVLGKQPRVTMDMISDGQSYELSTTMDTAWRRAEELRTAARQALIEQDSKERLARARRSREDVVHWRRSFRWDHWSVRAWRCCRAIYYKPRRGCVSTQRSLVTLMYHKKTEKRAVILKNHPLMDEKNLMYHKPINSSQVQKNLMYHKPVNSSQVQKNLMYHKPVNSSQVQKNLMCHKSVNSDQVQENLMYHKPVNSSQVQENLMYHKSVNSDQVQENLMYHKPKSQL